MHRRRALLAAACAIAAGVLPARAASAQARPATLDSTDSRAVYRLAEARRDENLPDAIALFRLYVRLEPGDPWGHIALGDALGAHGDLGGARAAYAAARRLAPGERDVGIGFARMLARAGRTDEAIGAYEAWLATAPRDGEAWRELAALRRRAGRPAAALAALETAHAIAPAASDARDRERMSADAAATIEPFASASRDSDGITTSGAGLTFTGPAIGRSRAFATVGVSRAGDPVAARAGGYATAGVRVRPLAQLELLLEGGVRRADRSFVDTSGVVTTPGGGGAGPGMGGRPIGRPIVAGVSNVETIPVGRARLVWRVPGDRVRLDARASRTLLDASPYLVAQGVTRAEIGAEVDVRAVGPLHVRAFGRTGSVGNEEERNGRRIVGGALAIAPRGYDLSLRGQELSYTAPTELAYFAPRYVRTMELTAYTEREIEDVLLVFDLGAGMQRVAAWTDFPSDWSPALRGWAQLVTPLASRVSLVLEAEGYDSRVGAEQPSFGLPEGRWRFGSVRASLRTRF